jgi:hypothetical protein
MIASGVVVYVSCQPVDFRKGAASLMALVRDGGLDPFNGALYVFRSKRTIMIHASADAMERQRLWPICGICQAMRRSFRPPIDAAEPRSLSPCLSA